MFNNLNNQIRDKANEINQIKTGLMSIETKVKLLNNQLNCINLFDSTKEKLMKLFGRIEDIKKKISSDENVTHLEKKYLDLNK